jgi:predicted nucleic acid-binding Zn ribbon protein
MKFERQKKKGQIRKKEFSTKIQIQTVNNDWSEQFSKDSCITCGIHAQSMTVI